MKIFNLNNQLDKIVIFDITDSKENILNIFSSK
jgi:hypothetical protein